MEIIEFGRDAKTVLIQPVNAYDLSAIDTEIRLIREMTKQDFQLVAVKTDRWNHALSPWQAPAVFGDEPFGGGAAETLAQILSLCADSSKTYYLGGYSLAGLFALWAAYQTDLFTGIAAASPSVWFPDFSAYMQTHLLRTGRVYLSLGDREEKTRHSVMSAVGDCIRADFALLQSQGIACTLEWNKGGHFTEPDLRTAKAFSWLMQGG
ncbi:MAG: esterase [Oscillospiraceae bacterium]|nr:esterase [Oscillospiraceae bacterium]